MSKRSLSALSLLIAGELFLFSAPSLAQQPSPPSPSDASPARAGYYSRVQSQTGGTSAASGARYRTRVAQAARGGSADDPLRTAADPLRAYGSESRSSAGGAGAVSRPYEQAPVASPPERETPAPVVSHNYFPGYRGGQSANHNVVRPHCVPGRHGLMGR